MESARAAEDVFGTGKGAKPACPRCASACSYRTKRRPWERLLGLRAFRCTLCSRRFAKMNRDAEPWRSLRIGRVELVRRRGIAIVRERQHVGDLAAAWTSPLAFFMKRPKKGTGPAALH
jgi:hypothetical protein